MKLIQLLFFAISLTTAIQAEPLDEHHKLAFELVELTSKNRPDDVAFRNMIIDQIDKVIPELKLDEKNTELFREAALGAAGAVTANRLIEILANAYANRLSVDELKGIIAFYKTDAGQAWLRESEAIERERLTEKKAAIAEVLKETRQRFEELKKQDIK